MAIEVTLPRQGWTMEEAVFVEWFKQDGDEVLAGERLYSVETEKAVQEIEALDAGTLRFAPNAPGRGDTVRVGEVFGYLLAEGEAMPPGGPAPKRKADVSTPLASAAPPRPGAVAASVPLMMPTPGGPPVSPRAARRAVREGVDLRTVQGTGKGGRIRESDVLAALHGQGASRAASSCPPDVPGMPPIPGREAPLAPLRRTIAARMHRSKTLTAPVTLTTRVDAAALVRWRERLKADPHGAPVPAYGDIILREAALTLLEHPALNARWEDDHLRFPDAVNIGFAVDTEAGLVAPVVHDAQKRSLLELARMTRDLAERARARTLSSAELAGGTFTLTNLGMAGIDAFTPVINWPECAVLGIGRITREPVVEGDSVVIGERMWLSLTFDHRIVDGAPAARFLDALRRRIEALSGGL